MHDMVGGGDAYVRTYSHCHRVRWRATGSARQRLPEQRHLPARHVLRSNTDGYLCGGRQVHTCTCTSKHHGARISVRTPDFVSSLSRHPTIQLQALCMRDTFLNFTLLTHAIILGRTAYLRIQHICNMPSIFKIRCLDKPTLHITLAYSNA